MLERLKHNWREASKGWTGEPVRPSLLPFMAARNLYVTLITPVLGLRHWLEHRQLVRMRDRMSPETLALALETARQREIGAAAIGDRDGVRRERELQRFLRGADTTTSGISRL